MSILRYIVYPLVFLTVLLISTIYWLCATTSGTAFLLGSVDSWVDAVSIGPSQGTLADRLHLDLVSVTTEAMDVDITNTRLQLDLFALLLLNVNLYELHIEQLDIKLSTSDGGTEGTGSAVNIPVNIQLADAVIQNFKIHSESFSRTVRNIHFSGKLSDRTLNINRFSASDELFTVSADLNLLLAPPWTLTAHHHFTADGSDIFADANFPGDQQISLRGRLDGDIKDIKLEGRLDSPQLIRYSAELALDEAPRGRVTLSAEQLDLSPLLSQPWTMSGSTLEVSGTLNRYEFTANGGVTPPEMPALTYSLKGSGDPESVHLANASLDLDEASAAFTGRLNFADELAVSGEIQAQQVPLSLANEELEGTIGLQGLLDYDPTRGLTVDLDRISALFFDREISGRLRFAGHSMDDAEIDGQLRLNSNELNVTTGAEPSDLLFDMEVPDLNAFHPSLEGRLTATGKANISPPFSISAEADGSLFERVLSGNLRASGSGPADVRLDARMRLGDNDLSVSGDRGEGRLAFELDAPTLKAVHPDIAGDLQAAGSIRLDTRTLAIQGQAGSNRIRFRGHDIQGLKIHIPETAGKTRSASLAWNDWQYGDESLGGLQANFDGTPESGELSLMWQRQDSSVELLMSLRHDERNFSGQLLNATVNLSEDRWTPDKDVSFAGSIRPVSLEVDPHCWRVGDASACFPIISVHADTAMLHADLKQIPVEFKDIAATLENVNLPANLGLKTLVDLGLKLRRENGVIDGSLEAKLPDTQISWSEDEDPLSISFAATGNILDKKLEFALATTEALDHAINASVMIPHYGDPGKFKFQLQLDGDYVPILTALVPPLSEGEGQIIADLRGNTTGPHPQFSGDVRVPVGASVVIPAAGIRVSDIEFRATALNADLVQFRGTGSSGDGTLTLRGEVREPLSGDRRVDLSVSGADFRAMNTSDLVLVTSPKLELQQSRQDISITGKVSLVDGDIRYGELDTGGRSISDDVIIDDVEPDRSMLSRASVDLDLEVLDKVHIQGFGLDANISGNLSLEQGSGSPPRAHGTLTLSNGTFSRYGQTLTIERGRLIYSGPLNNPTVDVVTSRTIRTADGVITVTLAISGPANSIQSQISSDPAMSEANALSWLILGRPLSSASNEEGNNLAGSAISLGLRKALPIAKEISSTLGLDEFDIAADTADSASIIAGKRISENLYVRYNYDVFSRIGGVLFTYALTPHLSVEAQSGESKSLELIYTF